MRQVVPFVGRYPTGFAQWLVAMDLAVRPIAEVAIVGLAGDPATQALVREARSGLRPGLVLAVAADPARTLVPLLADRLQVDGRPTAFVCRDFACRLPVTTPGALRAQLDVAIEAGGGPPAGVG
jgi:uncharacterized protein YyaL (SSP411 family)